MKKILFLSLLALTACTSSEQAPDINSAALPTLQLPDLQPRSLELKVENIRVINKEAGNAAEVEKAVSDSLVSVFKRSGIEVGSSPNKLRVIVRSCMNASKGYECVSLGTRIVTPKMNLEWDNSMEAGFSVNGGAVKSLGDVSPAYQAAIRTFLQRFETKFAEASKLAQ